MQGFKGWPEQIHHSTPKVVRQKYPYSPYKERNDYYFILEQTQRGSTDITIWIQWFFGCLERAYASTEQSLSRILQKADFWKRNAAVYLNNRQHTIINKLLDGFEGKLTTTKYAKITKCSSLLREEEKHIKTVYPLSNFFLVLSVTICAELKVWRRLL